jgi:oligopeptide transport system substrate-binding protein
MLPHRTDPGTAALRRGVLSERSRKPCGLVAVAAVLIAAALALGCCGGHSPSSGRSSPAAATTPVPGGTYNFPLAAEPISIVPLGAQESAGAQVEHQCFQGLYVLRQDADGVTSAVPDLAAGPPEVNSSATVFTFSIKHGVRFAPPVGREVTAQDFVDSWTYNATALNQAPAVYVLAPIQGIDPATGYVGKGGLTGVKALGRYTLQVTLKHPFADFPSTLAHPITHVFPVDYAERIGSRAFFDKPVGSGPYMVQQWVHNQSITLVKNPDYWNRSDAGDSAGPGWVDVVNMPIYNDIASEWLDFKKGSLDYSDGVPAGNVRATEHSASVRNGTWTAKAYPSTAVCFLSVAMNQPLLGGPGKGAANLPVRVALNYGADREAVCSIATEDVSTPSDEIVPPTIPGYKGGLNPYPYDPTKAQSELDKFAGTMPKSIPYWYTSGTGQDQVAQVLIAGWSKATPQLSFTLSGLETNAYWTLCRQGKAPALFRMSWVADYPSMDEFIYLFTTAGGKDGSFGRYSDPQVDRLFRQARGTLDPATRSDLYNQAQSLILEDAPCVPVYASRDFRVTNNRIGGFSYNAFGLVDMWNVWVK